MSNIRLDPRTLAPLRGTTPAGVALSPGEALAITSPIPVLPGQRVEVWAVRFRYRGPVRRVICGWALKPKTSIFGTNYNNGLSTIPSYRAFSAVLSVPNSPVTAPYSFEWPSGSLASPFGFQMPQPGTYNLEGSGTGQIIEGPVDTWVWLTDVSLMEKQGVGLAPQTMMREENLLLRIGGGMLIDTDSGPLVLGQVLSEGEALNLGYRNAG